MKNTGLRFFCALCLICSISFLTNNQARSQPAGTSNFLSNIKSYDLASLWHADHLKIIDMKEMQSFPEPLGIVGKNCQRFYIHYSSVVKDPTSPYKYKVLGKTRVGNQVRQITGTITIIQAGIYKPGNNPYAPEPHKGYRRGKVVSHIVINENGSTAATGNITGQMTTEFCIDAKNNLFYDTLDFGIDGYSNNQFTGTWTAHGSKSAQPLKYGDFSFQDDRFADTYGITVPPEFQKYGWISFVNAISDDFSPANKAAIAEEKRQWWK